MKEQYIKQVEKELSLTRKAKKEVVRDLNEVFASALEHGETEQQVIYRHGDEQHEGYCQAQAQRGLHILGYCQV